MMKTGLATITVQNSFCERCSDKIQTELQGIRDVSNIRLYPADSQVIFSFKKANELSDALNALTAMGYPPKEDRIDAKKHLRPLCNCLKSNQEDIFFNKSATAFKIREKEAEQCFNKAS